MFLGYTCPVPMQFCSGTPIEAGHQGMQRKIKWHQTPKDVHRCEGKYLVGELGYERLSNTTFRAPPGTAQAERGVLVLNRKPGSPVRTGKGGSGQGSGNKSNPGGRSMGHMGKHRQPFGEIW